MPTKRSKVHPTYKTKYRVTNWPEYDRGLVDRGDLTLWISSAAIEDWHPAPSATRGGQRRYSDAAVQTALTLRLLFRLPLRQTEGFLRSLLELVGLDLDVPDHTTLSRRMRDLELPLTRQPARGPVHLILDSSGLSIVGEGEWAAAKHGGRGKRGWRKLHLGVDADGVIVAQVLTDSCVDDACTGVAIIEHVPGELGCVTADAAYDTHDVYDAATARGAEIVVPPISSAREDERTWPRSPQRDATVRLIKAIGRREWKRESGYHRLGTVENAFFRWKMMLGPALRSRHDRAREVEAGLGCNILNRMLEMARPRSVAIVA
jgi:IS5 family transposase